MSRTPTVAAPTISLFPFLAVLLCMMGALLVLLVLFSRSAQHGETAEASQAREQLEQELELARDNLVWRREQLAGVRERTAADLATSRMQLAGIEENCRALEDEYSKLERIAAALESTTGVVAADGASLRALEARLVSARESLEKARADSKTKPPAYAVVPFAGRSGTHRRPLYIECCGDGVFLQPEGIRLSPSDFEGPPGPGNPLACALRAAREHMVASQGGTNDPAAQPYPLLLVRPSGVMAYYAAREAIQSWGSDFGYQLIDEDWTLTFPPPDPTLAQVERRAIEESRERLAWLAEVRPSRPAKPPRQYRAAPTRGGVVAEGGPTVLGDQSRWDWANNQAAAGAGGQAGGTGGSGDGSGSGNGSGSGGQRGGTHRSGSGGSDSGGDVILGGGGGGSGRGRSGAGVNDGHDGQGGQGGQGGHDTQGAGGASDAGGSTAGNMTAVGDRYSSTSRFGAGGAGSAAGGSGTSGGNQPGDGGGQSGGAAGGGADGAGGGIAGGAAGGAAGGSAGGSASGSASAGGAAGGGGSQAGSAGGGGGPAMPGLLAAGGGGPAGQSGGSASKSLSQSRGKNWASLATQDHPIPLTRPIRLECSLHEFRLIDDSGRRVETRIPLPGDTAEAVDPLVRAVHARVNAWGIAGERMYWKPQLVLFETSDGRSRREDLERLLAESGIETRSSDGRDEIRPLPPVVRTSAVMPGR